VRGAAEVAGQALLFRNVDVVTTPVLVNGVAGVFSTLHGVPFSLMAFTVAGDRIVGIEVLADRERLATLSASWPQPGR
jgi:RNA polymerase sigma-70 factor (ECF subfamily)